MAKKLVKVSMDQVRAAKLELRALESAGLRPDPMLRKLANAHMLLPRESRALDNGEAIDIAVDDGQWVTGTKVTRTVKKTGRGGVVRLSDVEQESTQQG